MKNKAFILTTIFGLLFIIPNIAFAAYGDAGFWSGLWHGVSFPFRIFLKFIWTDIIIYEQFHSTYWYHVGFFLGVFILIGGGSKAAD